jgi:AcrR family transcriptional regulator
MMSQAGGKNQKKTPKKALPAESAAGLNLKSRGHHHGDLKQALVRVAVDYLKEGTANDLSLRELARRAGVSQAAPYRHFTDKDQLLAAIAADGYGKLGDFMSEALAQTSENIEEQFHRSALSYLRMATDYPEHFKLMSGSAIPQESFFLYPQLYLAAQRAFFGLVRMILNCQKAGLIGAGCPVRRAFHCWCTVHGFAALYSLGRIAWLGVDASHYQAALRGLTSDLLRALQPSDQDLSVPFSPILTPMPRSVMEEVGLTREDFLPKDIVIFDDREPWPDLSAFFPSADPV